MTDKRKSYIEQFDAQLKEWSAQIVLIRAKADKTKADAKIDYYYKTIEPLEDKLYAVRAKLQELRTAGDDAWEELKTGAENIWAEVKTGFREATSKFK